MAKRILRAFALSSKGTPKTPEGVEVVQTAPERFPCVLDSDAGRRLLHEQPPADLRQRFAFYLRDDSAASDIILYVVAPQNNGKTWLQPVPAKLLVHFYSDASSGGEVPPADRLVDTRYTPTRAQAFVTPKPEPEPEPVVAVEAAVLDTSKPKPKRAPAAKGKGKGKGKVEPEQKVIVIDPCVEGVYPYEKEEALASDDIEKYKMWIGGTNNAYKNAASVLEGATGMVPDVARCGRLCVGVQ